MCSGTIAGLGELTTATKLRHLNLRRLQLGEPGHRQCCLRLEIPPATRASGSAFHFSVGVSTTPSTRFLSPGPPKLGPATAGCRDEKCPPQE